MLIAACGEPSTVGAEFVSGTSFDVSFSDTITIRASTVIYDSIETNNKNRLLVGAYDDPNFGIIESQAFFQLSLDKTYKLDENNTSYDSLTLCLKYDQYFYYDTLEQMSLSVFRLSQEIELDEEEAALYNTSTVQYLPEGIGSTVITPLPVRRDSFEIRLSDKLGMDLMRFAHLEAEELSNQEKFQDFLKGLLVKLSDFHSPGFVGFSPETKMKLYYRNKEKTPTEQEVLTFTVENSIYFNRIISEREGTLISKLNTLEEPLSSTSTENLLFVQSGSGIATRIELPFLRDLLNLGEDFLFTNVILEFNPVRNAYNDLADIPETLEILQVDENNVAYGVLRSAAVLERDLDFPQNNKYVANISSFVSEQMELDQQNANALLLRIPGDQYFSSTDRILIGDNFHENRMKVLLYHISIK